MCAKRSGNRSEYGADWIKFYADRRYYLGDDGKLHSWVNFTDEEMKALVDESHRLGRKVAAHAIGWDGIDAALRAGVNSIEHGDGLTAELVDRMVKQKVYWCPTIFVGVYVAEGRGGIWPKMVELEKAAFGMALRRGLLPFISYGTDAGGYAWDQNQAQELDYMVRYGMTPMQAIKSTTTVAARLLDQSANLGAVSAGAVRGPDCRGEGSAGRYHRTAAGAVRDEGRSDLQGRAVKTRRWPGYPGHLSCAVRCRSHTESGPHSTSSASSPECGSDKYSPSWRSSPTAPASTLTLRPVPRPQHLVLAVRKPLVQHGARAGLEARRQPFGECRAHVLPSRYTLRMASINCSGSDPW